MFSQESDGSEITALNQVAHDRYYALLSVAQGTG